MQSRSLRKRAVKGVARHERPGPEMVPGRFYFARESSVGEPLRGDWETKIEK